MRILCLAAFIMPMGEAAGPAAAGQRAPLPERRPVRIAAASDLRFVLKEVVARLRAAPFALDVQVTYGSSGTLFAQLVNGAPFDMFMSADIDYPRRLAARGLAIPGTEFTYAVGRLAVWVQASSLLDPEMDGMQVLVDPRVMHVSMANPATAPYGRAAEAAMREANVYDRVKPKIVLGENVAQALQFVQSGAADVGLVALSLAVAPMVNTMGRYRTVPEGAHPRMEQGGIILRAAADVGTARVVRAFLLGDKGRAILSRYGLSPSGT